MPDMSTQQQIQKQKPKRREDDEPDRSYGDPVIRRAKAAARREPKP